MISALLVSTLFGAGPDLGSAIREVRRTFIEDGDDRVSATATHRVVSHPDGSLELQGRQPLRVSLLSVRRERGESCTAGVLSREVAARTVRIHRACALDESWTNEVAGLEQTFTLQRAPRGSGELRLRLSVEGPWHHQDAAGQVFGGPGAVDVLRYGNAFVVQQGRRVKIPVVHVEGGLELRVPRALLDAPGAFPMFIDPVLSVDEVPLDPDVSLSLLSSQESQPAIAVDGSGRAFVAWTDNRRQVQTDIFGARFDHTGLLDPTGLPLVTDPGHQRHPALSWDGTSFLLAWEQELQLPDGGSGGQVFARTISQQGAVAPAAVLLTPGTQPVLAGVADGGYSVLAWLDDQLQVKVARVGAGMQFSPYYAPINPAAGGRSTLPAVTANARAAFVAWERSGAGNRISSIQGHWVGGTTPVIELSDAGEARRPAVALLSTGTEEEALVYFDEPAVLPSVGGVVVRGPAVTSLPSFLGTTPAVVRTSETAGGGALGFVGPLGGVNVKDLDGGSTYNLNNLSGRRPTELALAAGGGLFAVWIEGLGDDVHGLTLSLPIANTTASGVPISTAATMQLRPNVALHGTHGLAVWIDGVSSIGGATVQLAPDGVTVDGGQTLLTVSSRLEQVDLAAGPGEIYLLTWRQSDASGSATYSLIIDPNSAMPPSPVRLSQNAVAGPAVAWDEADGKFIVAWVDQGLPRTLLTSLVSPAGVADLALDRASDAITDTDVTCLGSGTCLLTWGVRPLLGMPSVNSLVLNSGTASLQTVTGAAEPAASHDGTDFFLGWRSATGLGFAKVDHLSGALTLVDGPVTANTNPATQLTLAPANPPIAAWTELGADAGWVRFEQVGQPTLTVAEGMFPVLATSDTLGVGLIVYQRYDPDAGVRAVRAYGMSFRFDAGLPDAGLPDSGVDGGLDAGLDAGLDDGGSDAGAQVADAGVMTFQTSGCACDSASLAPWVLLALAMLRRR